MQVHCIDNIVVDSFCWWESFENNLDSVFFNVSVTISINNIYSFCWCWISTFWNVFLKYYNLIVKEFFFFILFLFLFFFFFYYFLFFFWFFFFSFFFFLFNNFSFIVEIHSLPFLSITASLTVSGVSITIFLSSILSVLIFDHLFSVKILRYP